MPKSIIIGHSQLFTNIPRSLQNLSPSRSSWQLRSNKVMLCLLISAHTISKCPTRKFSEVWLVFDFFLSPVTNNTNIFFRTVTSIFVCLFLLCSTGILDFLSYLAIYLVTHVFAFCWWFHCLKWSTTLLLKCCLVFISSRRLWCALERKKYVYQKTWLTHEL
jgi:hypothetical protein